MKFLTIVLLIAICGKATAHQHQHHDHHDQHDDHHYSHANYDFEYGVKDPKTGDIKDQWEHRNGNHVKGAYSLKEADGTTRVVEYHADGKSGFHAHVKRLGHARHPEAHHGHHGHHHNDHGPHHGHYHHHEVHHDHSHHFGHNGHHDHAHAISYASVKLH